MVPELYDIDDFSDAATSIVSVESDDDISTAKGTITSNGCYENQCQLNNSLPEHL